MFLTTIQKFSKDINLLSNRANIICISDEAHRSQTGIEEKVEITDTGVRRSYGFAKYLIFGNLQPEADDEYGTYCGFPYGLLDLSTTNVGDAYAVAICCRNKSTTSAGYYFLDETGKIWQTNQSYSSSTGISFSSPTLVWDTGINAGLQYNSIYYDGTHLYWTHQDGNDAILYILANANTAASRKIWV